MLYLKNSVKSFALVFSVALLIGLPTSAFGQDRDRVVQPRVKKTVSSRPVTPRSEGLTNKIIVRNNPQVKKTGSNKVIAGSTSTSSYMAATTRAMMMESIRDKIGLRYRYGTQGPRTYDCSGFIWKVFSEAGIDMTRTSAREFWRQYEPVTGDDRFQFGTLVFFNRLGHVGIVADKNGFYHASSSRGVTYSKFAGYWSRRIVGFRRVPIEVPTWDGADDEDADTEQ